LPELDASQTAQAEWEYADRTALPGTLHSSHQQSSGSVSFLGCEMGDADFEEDLVHKVNSQRVEGVDLCCTVVD
jgi:hypothetical protein